MSGLLFLLADGSQRVEHAVLERLGGGEPEAWIELQQAVEDVDEALVLDRRKLCSDVAFLRLIAAGVLLLLSKRQRADIPHILQSVRLGDEGEVKCVRLPDEVEDVPQLIVIVNEAKRHVPQR